MAAGCVHVVQCATHMPISSRHSSMQQVLYGAVDAAAVCATNTQPSSKTQMATHERMGRTIGRLNGVGSAGPGVAHPGTGLWRANAVVCVLRWDVRGRGRCATSARLKR